MSLHLGIRRPRKHRAVDAVANLRDENRRLLGQVVGAGDVIALLERQLIETRAKQADAERVAICLTADLEEMATEGIDLLDRVDALEKELAPYLAAEANAAAVTVPEMERDTSAIEDQATAPIDVRELRARFAAGPVVDLHYSPQAADPTHIPVPVT